LAEASRLVNSNLAAFKRTIDKYEFLEYNSRAVVGISGGVDSLVLLFLLAQYNEKYRQGWEIHPCHVDPRFAGWDTAFIEEYCKTLGMPCKIIRTGIGQKLMDQDRKCFVCSRERRRRLLEFADSLNIFQIVLAHNLEDVVETFILNIVYNGVISAFVPRQPVIRGRFCFVRPLYFLSKKKVLAIARSLGIPENRNSCPYAAGSKREKIRDFLKGVKEEYPEVYTSIFRGMLNVKTEYLP
jgi:tRNA 2-thiocytidine biosynthesis protein TtcA